ncbi:MAG: hypothetical protein COV67_09070 [Nitrospinae bacterium CG11_big_fil_rev_8_21_14_0_20_56_8]|nr:MAG: hypothetical protein COV67_09070 [Nitrospinae bacterium CG11_big_fil_rev_8_21_14_0_20_56_8]
MNASSPLKRFPLIITLVLWLGGLVPLAQAATPNEGAVALLVTRDAQGQELSTGSGFVVKPEGTLITNYHVLVDAASVDAVFPDGRIVPVEGIYKVDRRKDFAVLKLQKDFYSTLEIGNSATLKDFDYAQALGYLSQSLTHEGGKPRGTILQTHGFVLGQHMQAYPDFPFIYTTAAFGPGFSGGPLLNLENRVVGIATVEGRAINLALPIDFIKPYLNESQIQTVSQLLDEDKNSAEARYYRGNFSLYSQGDPDRAIAQFQEVLKMNPNFAPAHYDLATAYRDKGMIPQSIAEYEKTLKIHPKFPEAMANLASYYFRDGRTKESAALLENAIKIYPNFIQAHSNLGAILNKLERYDDAIEHLNRTLALDPEFEMAYFNLGNAQFALNRLDEARQSFEHAQNLGIDFLSLHWKLYEIHQRQGNLEEAKRELRIILEIDPENPEARQKLADLSR